MVTDPLEMMAAACERHGAPLDPTRFEEILGVSDTVVGGLWPINGLRHRRGKTSGWFVWAGEDFSEDSDFFKPMHAAHLVDGRPEVVPMLGLPAGYRFLIAPGYEDVWFDAALLDHSV